LLSWNWTTVDGFFGSSLRGPPILDESRSCLHPTLLPCPAALPLPLPPRPGRYGKLAMRRELNVLLRILQQAGLRDCLVRVLAFWR